MQRFVLKLTRTYFEGLQTFDLHWAYTWTFQYADDAVRSMGLYARVASFQYGQYDYGGFFDTITKAVSIGGTTLYTLVQRVKIYKVQLMPRYKDKTQMKKSIEK